MHGGIGAWNVMIRQYDGKYRTCNSKARYPSRCLPDPLLRSCATFSFGEARVGEGFRDIRPSDRL